VREFSAHHPVDRSRTHAVGFSMGASAAWLAAAREPTLFAAILPIPGIAPADAFAVRFRHLPVLVIHGDSDPENPIAADRRFHAAIRDAGGTKARFRVHQGMQHRMPDDLYPGFWWRDWLFSQSR
jgi:dienelactone hydrolase